MWVTEATVPKPTELWLALANQFAATGLWPVLVSDVGRASFLETLGSPASVTPPQRADAVLRQWWQTLLADPDAPTNQLFPFNRTFPGLAAPSADCIWTIAKIAEEALGGAKAIEALEFHLGLVPAERPADVTTRISFSGAANYDLDPAEVSVVLAAWEDRFGAFLVGLSGDTMQLAVTRPATTKTSTQFAAEVYAMCPDIVTQGVDTIDELGRTLAESPGVYCWWD
jgi:hypothetical protein